MSGTLGAILPPTTDKYLAAEKVNVDLKAVLDKTKVADGEELFALAKLNLANVDANKAKENKIDIDKKIKNIAQIKSDKDLAIKNTAEYVNSFTASDTTFTKEEFAIIKEKEIITATYPTFVGFTIKTLYDFFMVFVVLCGIAAMILFLLTPVIKKMMHGVR